MKNITQVNENLILHYEDGLLYKVEKPTDKISIDIDFYGTKHWYKNGQFHRDNGPAIERASGTKCWYKNGRIHRDNDLPAIECANGYREWWLNGQLHRDNDLPAIECANGYREWWKNGQFIRSEKGYIWSIIKL